MNSNIRNGQVPIEGKVSTVLNERELVINVGINIGVKVGMKFKVLADKMFEVKDPDTGKLLGTIDREKVRVQASEVSEKFAICKTYRQIRKGGGGLYIPNLSEMLALSRTEPETLRAEDSTLPPPLSEEESYVKKGDRVIEIVSTEG
jgi:hypothetical protein